MNDHWKKKAQEARTNQLSSQIEVWREWKEDEQHGTQNIGLRFFVDALVEEYERLRDLVDFTIAAIDSNHCYMGEEAQADLLNYLRGVEE